MSHLFAIYLWIFNDLIFLYVHHIFPYVYIYIFFVFIYYIHILCPGEIWLSRAAEVEALFLLAPGLQILSAVPGGHEEGSATGLRVDMAGKQEFPQSMFGWDLG